MQSEERRRLTVPKRGFARRYPRSIMFLGTTLAMCLLYSKPIYDIFFSKPPENIKPDKSKTK